MTKKSIIPFFSILVLSACAVAPTPNSNLIEETTVDQIEVQEVPINNALPRIIKKPFGIKVSPENSPVDPEIFSGYHTGTDFEIVPEEEDTEVSIYSICDGPTVLKRFVSGYGGVVVQECSIEDEEVTVIYGHLHLDSISTQVNKELSRGAKIGILGKGYSEETDGERKHLHLGIHKGNEVNLRGYVGSKDLLEQWINPEDTL
ncbi:M23 family metallopeptidase [Pseudomonadota bacterium]